MNNNKIKATSLIRLFEANRGAGSTQLMINGILNSDRPCILVAHTRQYAEQLLHKKRLFDSPTVMTGSIDSISNLYGYIGPVAVDHKAVTDLLSGLICDIDSQNDLIHKIMDLCEVWQERLYKFENLTLTLLECKWWDLSKKRRVKKELRDLLFNHEFVQETRSNLEKLIRLSEQNNW